jgi:methyl-accepting chemotaxis protein
MEEVVWRITRQSRDLQELRMEIHAVWDDGAAREINGRYLNVHAEESEQVHRALEQQHLALQEVKAKLLEVNDLALRANELANQIEQTIQMVQQESKNAHASYEQCVENFAAARSLIPVVYKTIEEANHCCS